MRIRTSFALALVALLGIAPSAPGSQAAAATAKSCGSIGFTANSDDIAAQIRASRVSCKFARRFVRESRGHPGASFWRFRCASTEVPAEGLQYRRFRCTHGRAVITWRRY